jgi:AhpD family alkylhydroperoxidase
MIVSKQLCIVNNDITILRNKMANFNVPSRKEVSANNQEIFDNLQKGLGMVPNLYAVMAHSETALGNYLAFQNAKTSFSNKEKQAVNLVVSQVNECVYCQSAHTLLGTMNGLTEDQTIEIRKGNASFDDKLNSLVVLAKEITAKKGFASSETIDAFIKAGYNEGQVIELVFLVAEKTAMNYVQAITKVVNDFPIAKSI